jgi:hypothetical protein
MMMMSVLGMDTLVFEKSRRESEQTESEQTKSGQMRREDWLREDGWAELYAGR